MYVGRACDDGGGGDDEGDEERPIQEVLWIVVLGLDDRSDGLPFHALSVLAVGRCDGSMGLMRGR